jgi:hypothetical protein
MDMFMSTPLFLLTLLTIIALLYVVIAATAYVRMRGVRVVVCPETARPAAVTISAARAALSAICEQPGLRVAQCSRWPERTACNEACTAQVAVAPRETLAFSIVKRWYAGKTCALCLEPIGPPPAVGAQPGLLNLALTQPPDTVTWRDVPADELPSLFSTHLPVCARCHVREQFGAPARNTRKPAGAGAGTI